MKQRKSKKSKLKASNSNDLQSSAPSVDCMTSRDFQADASAHIEVIAQRLRDEANLRNFADAIVLNRHLFRGRTVLDVGCGLGILSLFAAKAGAARVYAVDCSNVVDYTRRIVTDNGYGDVIHVIKGDIKDIELPELKDGTVDVIVCDWMGYSLFFQSALDAVLYARDKWLRKDGAGVIFPDMAELFVGGLEDNRHKCDHIEWWSDVYGFNMRCLRQRALSEPSFQRVMAQQVLTTQYTLKTLNLYTATFKDLQFRCKFVFEGLRSGLMDGIVTFFHVHFSKSHTRHSFSTGPTATPTRWLQSVFFFDKSVSVGNKQRLYGGIKMHSTNKNVAHDMNNMELVLEMFSGDAENVNLEVQMCWQLRSHTCAVMPQSANKMTTVNNKQQNAPKVATKTEEKVLMPKKISPCKKS